LDERAKLRRSDRDADEGWIREFLHESAVGYRPITAGELKRTSVFRLDIESWSGKRKYEKADFPGAYLYEERDRLAADSAD
jgi:hypothetical protein